MAVYAFDQGMSEAIFDLEFAPDVCLHFFGRSSATVILRQRQQSLSGVGAAIQHQIFSSLSQILRKVIVDT